MINPITTHQSIRGSAICGAKVGLSSTAVIPLMRLVPSTLVQQSNLASVSVLGTNTQWTINTQWSVSAKGVGLGGSTVMTGTPTVAAWAFILGLKSQGTITLSDGMCSAVLTVTSS